MLPAEQAATAQTREACAATILSICVERFKRRAGETLLRAHLSSHRTTRESIKIGVDYAVERGWLQDEGALIRLTQSGYDEFAALMARELLRIFVDGYKCTAGGMLGEHNVLSLIKRDGLNLSVYTVGIQHAVAKGWLTRLPSTVSYRLTEHGAAESRSRA
jgi:hypothetical protein